MKQNRRNFIRAAGTAMILPATIASAGPVVRTSTRHHAGSSYYDMVVCGGGPAGCAAALAARREGLKVLLVEMQAQLGGTGTSGLVSHWLGGRNMHGEWIVGGIFKSLVEEAHNEGFALIPSLTPGEKYQPHGWLKSLVTGIPFDPYAMASMLDRKMSDAGVDVLLMTKAIEVNIKGDRLRSVVLNNKSGSFEVRAGAFADCTGDGDIMVMSGCRYLTGREEDNLTAPATLMFHVYNVDQDKLAGYIVNNDAPRLRKEIMKLREEGKWTLPVDIFISVQMMEKGTMMINTSRLTGIDGTDGASVTRGLVQGRSETMELFALMKEYFPGFRNARIKSVSGMLGIRESRRIQGDFVLTVDDLITGKTFGDTIGFSGYGWDLPDPEKPSLQPMSGKKIKAPARTPIPYRTMLPSGIENLICAGRMISVERDVLGPLRVMAPCMAMGEAAGTAAAQVVGKECPFNKVDVGLLKNTLMENNVIL